MRSEIRGALATLATTAVLLGSATMALAAEPDPAGPGPTPTATSTVEPTTPTPTPTPGPEETPPPPSPTPTPIETTREPETPPTARRIDDAQLRWGLNDESNNRAFAPGTFNFLSAGKIPNPGRGGVIMPQSGWKQAEGAVRIEKYLNGAWTPATWAGRQQTSTGATMSGTNGPFSNHEVVISGGTGTVDPTTGTAVIQWRGSFTALYYSGYSFFYVTDPKLTVTDGIGTLTGTLSGYGASMDDLDSWEAVPPIPDVELADLGTVDLSTDLGFTATPAYSRVAVSVGADHVPQVRAGPAWGSFPQSFVDYQLRSGSGAYWYSSGGAADAHKVAKPVTVSYAAGSPVTATPPSSGGPQTPPVENGAPNAPDVRTASLTGTAPTGPPAAPVPGDRLLTGSTVPLLRPASTVLGATTPPPSPDDTTGIWILGGVLLASALVVTARPFTYTAVRTRR